MPKGVPFLLKEINKIFTFSLTQRRTLNVNLFLIFNLLLFKFTSKIPYSYRSFLRKFYIKINLKNTQNTSSEPTDNENFLLS